MIRMGFSVAVCREKQKWDVTKKTPVRDNTSQMIPDLGS